MLAICVRFCSCLCKTCSCTCFRSSLTCFADLDSLLTNSSSDSKAFQNFIAFSGSPTVVHRAFLFFDAKAWPQSQTDLFTCTTVLHCGNTFLRHIHLIYGITLWAYLPEPLVKDSHKSLSWTVKTTLRRIKDRVHLFCVRCLNYLWGGRYCTTNRNPVVSM